MNKVAIIIPTYNEAENIGELLQAIIAQNIENLFIYVVDDLSPDGTGAIVHSLEKNFPVRLLQRAGKMGLGSAYIEGFKKALAEDAELIFEMDADFSHDPKDIPRMIEAANGADLVIGSRRMPGGSIQGWSLWRHLASRSAMSLSRLVLGLETHDVTSGFRCYRKSALEQINLDEINSNGYAFQEEMVWLCEKLGLKIKEIPVNFIDRNFGKSKLGTREIAEFFLSILKLKLKK
jgi:dolichol-phosphate mannosyltransferase